jgi:predicted homoserine dehydrogenase-like protein
MSYRKRLIARERELGRPVRVGLVGAGQMGRGLIDQVHRIPGMEVAAVADIKPGLAETSLRAAHIPDITTGTNQGVLAEVVAAGGHVATTDADVLVRLPVDIVIEASGLPEVAATVALQAIMGGKHVGLLTVEADVTAGLLLSRLAAAAGRVYTVCRGDEPVEAKRLVTYAQDLGFEVICAGKGKNNRIDRTATAQQVTDEANRRGMNPTMLTSFLDGSKTMIEMAALSNATGLGVSQRGMHGPAATVDQLTQIFATKDEGGLLDRANVVDYATGPIAPGVFCVARSDSKLVREEMAYLKMGDGPSYVFYRPYHLASVEAPLTIAAAVLDHKPDLAPIGWSAEVIATAKRDLHPGEDLDGIGGTAVYGLIEDAGVAASESFLPLGLAYRARVTRAVRQGEPLRYDDVELDSASTLLQLRRLQDKLASFLAVSEEPAAPQVTGAWDGAGPVAALLRQAG